MRRVLTALLRLMLYIFYRRIEFVGLENLHADRPLIFAVNHPNGLLDPLFVLSFASRPVSFLAKAPLFRYPLIGWIVRGLDSIPVFRKEDETTGSNRETFARAREILRRGGSIAIFPEGTTHSDPQLHPLKTGAARIALGAELPALDVVPTGIYYSEKQTFRSNALVMFGAPIPVTPEPVDENGEPRRESVERLTEQIDEGLDAVTLQADSHAALELIAKAEDIFSGAGDEQPVAEEFELRRRFIEGYHFLRANDPFRLAVLEAGIMHFAGEAGSLDVKQRTPPVAAFALLPFAIAGAIVNYPTYRLIGFLTNRLSKENEMRATMKFVGALMFYPLTWIAIAIVVWWRINFLAAIATLITIPILGYAALRVFESIAFWLERPRKDLAAKREAIRDEISRVAEEMARATASTRE